jgi:hypothetical protein
MHRETFFPGLPIIAARMNGTEDKKINVDDYGVEVASGTEKQTTPPTSTVKHLEHLEGGTSEQEWHQILQDAIESEAQERALSWKQALKLYPQACFWSFAISLCIVM